MFCRALKVRRDVGANLTRKSLFTPEELSQWYKRFMRGNPGEVWGIANIEAMYEQYFPGAPARPFATCVFLALLPSTKLATVDSELTFEDLAKALSQLLRGTEQERGALLRRILTPGLRCQNPLDALQGLGKAPVGDPNVSADVSVAAVKALVETGGSATSSLTVACDVLRYFVTDILRAYLQDLTFLDNHLYPRKAIDPALLPKSLSNPKSKLEFDAVPVPSWLTQLDGVGPSMCRTAARAPGVWQTVRIFLSSTFVDMQGERDVIVKDVIPELNRMFRDRWIRLVPVDLRWGVQGDQVNRIQLTCLNEIDRCRTAADSQPWLIGLRGERYGWVQDDMEPPAAFDNPDNLQWMSQADGPMSITAMELTHSVCGTFRPSPSKHAFVYKRENRFLESVPTHLRWIFEFDYKASNGILGKLLGDGPAQATARTDWKDLLARRDRLDRALAASPHCVFGSYPCTFGHARITGRAPSGKLFGVGHVGGLHTFRQMLVRDLSRELNVEFPPMDSARIPDPLALEEAAQQGIVSVTIKGFVGRQWLLDELLQRCSPSQGGSLNSSNAPLMLTGQAGSGKTCLLAKFARLCERDVFCAQVRAGTLLVITHLVGSTSASTSLSSMLARLCNELIRKSGLRVKIALPLDVPSLAKRFRELLTQCSEKCRIVIIVDAVDQLQTEGGAPLSWLPVRLPERVNIILSTTSQTPGGDAICSQLAANANVHGLSVTTVRCGTIRSMDERRLMVSSLLSRYQKTLTEEQMGLLLAKPASSSPLFLAAACEELRIFGVFELLTATIAALPATTHGLMCAVLDRTEREHGHHLSSRVLALLCVSQHGVFEDEVIATLPLLAEGRSTRHKAGGREGEAAGIFRLLASLRSFVQTSGDGLLRILHTEMRVAVTERYLRGRMASLTVVQGSKSQTDTVSLEPVYHRSLARYFLGLADPTGDGTFKGGVAASRSFSQLPYHLLKADSKREFQELLLNVSFLAGKCMACGLRATLSDFSFVQSDTFLRQRQLSEFQAFLLAESHVLTAHPELFFQQAFNQHFESLPAQAAAAIRTLGGDQLPLTCAQLSSSSASSSSSPTCASWLRLLTPPTRRSACLRTLSQHTDYVLDVCVSPDGRTVATASFDNSVVVYDAVTGNCVTTLAGHTDGVCCVRYSPDGRYLLSGSKDTTARLWPGVSRAKEGESSVGGAVLCVLSGHSGYVNAVCFSAHDSGVVATASRDISVRVWRLGAGGRSVNLLHRLLGHSDDVLSCQFSPVDPACLLSSSSDRSVRLWDWASGKSRVLLGHTDDVNDATFSPDGKHIASGGDDYSIRIWDTGRGECTRMWANAHDNDVSRLIFIADGSQLISCSYDRTVKHWDTCSGKLLSTFTAHSHFVNAVALSPNESRLYTAADDLTCKVWDTAHLVQSLPGLGDGLPDTDNTFPPIFTGPDSRQRHKGAVTALCYQPESAAGRTVSYSDRMVFSGGRDGRLIASMAHAGSWSGRIYQSSADRSDGNGGSVAVATGAHEQTICALAISPDGLLVVSASQDHTLKTWDLRSGKLCVSMKHAAKVTGCSLLAQPASHLLASCSWDKTVCLWDPLSGKKLVSFEEHSEYVACVDLVLSPPSTSAARPTSSSWSVTVASATDSELLIWSCVVDPRLDQQAPHITLLHTLPGTRFTRARFLSERLLHSSKSAPSSQGAVLLVCEGRNVRLIDGHGAQGTQGQYPVHSVDVVDACLSPCARYLVTLAGDTVTVWPSTTGPAAAVARYKSDVPLRSLSLWGTVNLEIAVGDELGRLLLLRLEQEQLVEST